MASMNKYSNVTSLVNIDVGWLSNLTMIWWASIICLSPISCYLRTYCIWGTREGSMVDHKFPDCEWSNSSSEILKSRWPGSWIGHEWVTEARKMRRQLKLNWASALPRTSFKMRTKEYEPKMYGDRWRRGDIPGHDFQSYRVTIDEVVWGLMLRFRTPDQHLYIAT